jgi:hypothetical protein
MKAIILVSLFLSITSVSAFAKDRYYFCHKNDFRRVGLIKNLPANAYFQNFIVKNGGNMLEVSILERTGDVEMGPLVLSETMFLEREDSNMRNYKSRDGKISLTVNVDINKNILSSLMEGTSENDSFAFEAVTCSDEIN